MVRLWGGELRVGWAVEKREAWVVPGSGRKEL